MVNYKSLLHIISAIKETKVTPKLSDCLTCKVTICFGVTINIIGFFHQVVIGWLLV